MSDQCKVGSIVDIANALQRAGQIMRGDVQMEKPKTMTTDELRAAKRRQLIMLLSVGTFIFSLRAISV